MAPNVPPSVPSFPLSLQGSPTAAKVRKTNPRPSEGQGNAVPPTKQPSLFSIMEDESKTLAKELHHKVIRKFRRRKVVVNSLDEIWTADLASMETVSSSNDGYKFILCIVDLFSRYAWCVALKNKNASTVLNAFKKVVKESEYHSAFGPT